MTEPRPTLEDAWAELEAAIPHKRWHVFISGDWENGWEAEVSSSLVAGQGSVRVSTNDSGWFHDPGGHRTPGAALSALAERVTTSVTVNDEHHVDGSA